MNSHWQVTCAECHVGDGASGWIGLILNRKGVDWDHVGEWLARSWREVAPKRLTRLMDVAEEF